MYAALPVGMVLEYRFKTFNLTTNLPEDIVNALTDTAASTTALPVVQVFQSKTTVIDSSVTADNSGSGKVITVERLGVGSYLATITRAPARFATLGKGYSLEASYNINVSGTAVLTAKAAVRVLDTFRVVKAEAAAGVPLVQTDAFTTGIAPASSSDLGTLNTSITTLSGNVATHTELLGDFTTLTGQLTSLSTNLTSLNGSVETHAQLVADLASLPANTAQAVLAGFVFNGDYKVDPYTPAQGQNGYPGDYLKLTDRNNQVQYMPVVLSTDRKAIVSSGLRVGALPASQ